MLPLGNDGKMDAELPKDNSDLEVQEYECHLALNMVLRNLPNIPNVWCKERRKKECAPWRELGEASLGREQSFLCKEENLGEKKSLSVVRYLILSVLVIKWQHYPPTLLGGFAEN